jgi:hypothetical protein
MLQFRNIDYSKLMFESLRNYFSVNKNGLISILFKFCLACTWTLTDFFNDFDVFRKKQRLIAYCNWQTGQLTNVLNNLFDSVLLRITITQSRNIQINVPVLTGNESSVFAPVLTGNESSILAYPSYDNFNILSLVTINIPTNLWNNIYTKTDIISTIAQIKISGIIAQVWDGIHTPIIIT